MAINKSKKNISERVRGIIEPTIEKLGYSIWDIEYYKEGADWQLRVTIDSEKGVDLDDVVKVSNAIDPILDEYDPIEEAYCLSVSSPGIERVIRTPLHYEACAGKKIDLKLYTAVDGMKQMTAVLDGISQDGETVTVTLANKTLAIGTNLISRANVHFDFDSEKDIGEEEPEDGESFEDIVQTEEED